MTNFIALYRGPSVSEARLIAISSEPSIVDLFIRELASEQNHCQEPNTSEERKPLHMVRGDEE